MVILKGTLATAPGATPVLPFALQLMLSSANRFGQAFLFASQPVTTTASTPTVPALTAIHIIAHPANS
jgi:hypothetical protein